MATALAYRVQPAAAVALVAATAKTVLTAIAPTGHGQAMTEFHSSCDGVTSSAVPIYVEIVSSTQVGAGTTTAATPLQVRGRVTAGQVLTAGSNYSAEPTTLSSLFSMLVPAFNGVYTYQFPLGREIECDSSAGVTKALGIRHTAPATVNSRSYCEVENI